MDINDLSLNDYSIKILDCGKRNITSLKGIEKFKNLEIFSCRFNLITDINEILYLHNLREFWCEGNFIEYIPDLKILKKLELLDISNNSLKSLKGIEYTDLKEIWFDSILFNKETYTILNNMNLDLINNQDICCVNNNLQFLSRLKEDIIIDTCEKLGL